MMYRLVLTCRTALSIGGHDASMFTDISTARDSDGVPIIPASGVKGALRIEFGRLLPDATSAAERLLGRPGRDGLLRFGDATLEGSARELFDRDQWGSTRPAGYQQRFGVAVSRKSRTVAGRLLYDRETTAPFIDDAAFAACVEPLAAMDANDEKAFEQFLDALAVNGVAIGSGKSRGLGHFDFKWSKNGRDDKDPAATAESGTGAYLVMLEPAEGFRVSELKRGGYLYETMGYCPGATFRGAVAGRLKGRLTADRFRAMFDTAPASFGAFYPSVLFNTAHPLPATARTCKAYPGAGVDISAPEPTKRRHGVVDALLADFLSGSDRCSYCGNRLEPTDGFYYWDGARPTPVGWQTRTATKLAVDERTMASAPGKLYSYETWDPRMRELDFTLVGRIAGFSADDIRQVASLGEVLVGGARGRGHGRMRIAGIRPEAADLNLAERVDALEKALRLPGGRADPGRRYFTVDLYSDLVLPAGFSLAELLHAEFGTGLELEAAWVQPGIAGGYNTMFKLPRPLMTTVRMGGCVLCSVPCQQDGLTETLQRIQNAGLGYGRADGFGHVGVCDRFHTLTQQT